MHRRNPTWFEAGGKNHQSVIVFLVQDVKTAIASPVDLIMRRLDLGIAVIKQLFRQGADLT